MTVGSLFAGIGGVDLGLERAGMRVRWQVEIDEFCRRVLDRHWPGVKRYGDIREVDSGGLEPVDIICGGFPCQPHSLAGRRRASEDERDLWSEFLRIIRGIKPRWVLAENVPGLLSSESGRFFGRVLRNLAENGYDVEWDCIPAAAVGAPHIRDRVWIIAHADGERRGVQQVSGAQLESETYAQYNGPQELVADPTSERRGRRRCCGTRQALLEPSRCSEEFGRPWSAESRPSGVAHGVPARVDRLRTLGNAVVPQVAQWIGERVMEAERMVSA